MKLETARLLLRTPEVQDAAAYIAIHNSDFVLRYNAMIPTTEQRMESKFTDPEYLENTVFLVQKTSNRLIGAIFLEEDSLRWGVASKELSYFVDEAYSRKGYMKEALQAVISYLFEKENLECIGARAFAPNVASRNLLKTLGFCQDGIIPRCVKGYGDVIFDDTLYSLFPANFCKGENYAQHY